MAIDQGTIGAENFKANDVAGSPIALALDSFDPTSRVAVYSFSRNWSYSDNGTISFSSTDVAGNQVADQAGNRLAANTAAGTLTIAIPVPGDTTPPTIATAVVSPTNIDTAGAQTVTLTVTFADVEA